MLNKDFDMAVVGENPFSYLLALELTHKGRQVVMLDNQRQDAGDGLAPVMGLLERELLRIWGQERGIAPFAEIDKYLAQEDLYFCVDGLQLRLGQDPGSNAREMARKLHGPWQTPPASSGLALSFETYTKNLAHRLYHSQGVGNFKAQSLLVECPPEVRKIFEDFLRLGQQRDLTRPGAPAAKEYWLGKAFLFATRAFFQWCPWGHASELEAYHLASCLLSPCYRVDAKALMRDLAALFKERGGQLKRTQISDWQTHQGRPWGVELASFDGIIHPRRLAFFGPMPAGLGLKLGPVPDAFQALNWKLPLLAHGPRLPEALWGRRVVWGEASRMGTGMPLLELVLGPQNAHGRILCERAAGNKVEFYRAEASAFLHSVLGQLFPWDMRQGADWEHLQLEFGPELWPTPPVEEGNRARRASKAINLHPKVTSLREHSFGERLHNVDYFGPLKEGVLGPLSVLLDVKDFVQAGLGP